MCPATVTRLSYLTPQGDDGSCCPFEGGARAEKLVKESGREREYKFLAASEGGGRLHRTETGRCGTGPSTVRATGSQVWQSPLDARASVRASQERCNKCSSQKTSLAQVIVWKEELFTRSSLRPRPLPAYKSRK